MQNVVMYKLEVPRCWIRRGVATSPIVAVLIIERVLAVVLLRLKCAGSLTSTTGAHSGGWSKPGGGRS